MNKRVETVFSKINKKETFQFKNNTFEFFEQIVERSNGKLVSGL